METVVVSIICIALILVGGMAMSQGFLSSVDGATISLDSNVRTDELITRSGLTALSASQPTSASLSVSLRNSGQTKMASFDKWDVIVQYTDSDSLYHVIWLPYVSGSPGDNQWTIEGIYLDSAKRTAEAFDPGILDPGEEVIVSAQLSPSVKHDSSDLVVISTEYGASASSLFAGK